MASNFFIDKKLRKKIEKDLKKRNNIEEKINKLQEELKVTEADIDNDLSEFYEQTDAATVISTIEHCEDNGGKKKKGVAKEIKNRYTDENLLIEDTLILTDWYEKMCKDYNNKI